MLADVTDKNDGSYECDSPDEEEEEPFLILRPDLFTGLVAIDDNYNCGGTKNDGLGQIKNTGYVVCQFYGGSDCSLDPAFFPPCPGRTAAAPAAATNRVYLPLISNNTTDQDNDSYYQNFPPLCP